jgi:predicted transcriptional regulator of viral defense system
MNYPLIQKLRRRLYFTVEDVAATFDVTQASARVMCNRYARRGIFVRLKNNMYVLDQGWQSMGRDDYLRLANVIQVPSYISFASALAYYEITTQVQRGYFESAALKRPAEYSAGDVVFKYYKLKKEYYFDFVRDNDLFIARKEKAFVDAVYLCSLGRYKMDFSALDLDKLDGNRLKKIVRVYPLKTRRLVKQLCKI